MSAKINVRSPYYKKYTHNSLGYVDLTISVATGLLSGINSNDEKYSLRKYVKGSDNYVVFEIAELVRDYITTDFDGTYNNQTRWVRLFANLREDSGVSITTDTLDLIAVDGYGYFEEGINPELSRRLLTSNKVVWRPKDENIRICVFTEDAAEVLFLNNGTTVRTESLSSTTNTNAMLSYVSVSGDISADNYKQRVLSNDGGVYEENPLLISLDNYVDINLVDEIRVHRGGTYDKLKIRTMHCNKYPDRKITFVNKFGVFQDVYFFAKEVESINTTSDEYKSNTIDFTTALPSYNVNKHQYKSFNVQAKEKIKLNTGLVSEDYNKIMKQMMMSEECWLTITTDEDSNIYPVKPKTNSLTYKTSLNDKLVSYSVDFDFAFDKIQNIR